MYRQEMLYTGERVRIRVYVLKVRGELRMSLQEETHDGIGWSFLMFGSWAPSVTREGCARATQAAVARFWNANLPKAKEMVAARVAVLEAV